MPLRKLFLFQLTVIVCVGVLHVAALYYSLYWQYPWFDVLLHFLGGAWVALALVWLSERFGYPQRVLVIFFGVLAVGAAWEVFEVIAGIPRESNYVFDTAVDLCMDSMGGAVGIYLSEKLL